MGVRLTLGYRKEKNRLVEEPAIAKMIDRNHMRGVSMEREVLSVAATEARTWAYGELSAGLPFVSCKSSLSETSSSSSSKWVALDDACEPSEYGGRPTGDGSSPLALNRASNRDPSGPSMLSARVVLLPL